MASQRGINRVVRDIVDLFELQYELWTVDSQEAKRNAMRAGGLLIAGSALLAAALATAMIGAGFLVNELAGWSVGTSLLSVAAATVVIVAGLLWWATTAIHTAAAAMSETKSEFVENLKWIKAVLISPETSPRNQIRAESFPLPDAQRSGSQAAASRMSSSSAQRTADLARQPNESFHDSHSTFNNGR
jgi:uncharacterized membrane protein YqjE